MLDAGAVERVDTAALQLLVVYQRELEQRGSHLCWAGTSPAFDEAADLLGLTLLLKLPAPELD
ncbi:MAG: STAS domain-containing protein [Rhodanobacter sp.]